MVTRLAFLLLLAHAFGVFYLGFGKFKKKDRFLKLFLIVIECLVLLGFSSFVIYMLYDSIVYGQDGDMIMRFIFGIPFIIQILWLLIIFGVIKNKKIRDIVLWLSIIGLVFGGIIFLIILITQGLSSPL